MKIAILNTSDAKGGAAIVSHRLLNGLCESGIDARMIVADKTTDNNRVASASSPSKRRSAFLLERLDIFAENGFSRKNLFKVSTARFGSDALSHEWIRQADIVCINWINQGFLSLADIARLHEAGKKSYGRCTTCGVPPEYATMPTIAAATQTGADNALSSVSLSATTCRDKHGMPKNISTIAFPFSS